ncbi:MAG: hypothetical protein JWQ94_2205 [Tardiphaga sp.]|jgi:hypothetical protein|nr:hypothetical protein [Tardiphaga sp.]
MLRHLVVGCLAFAGIIGAASARQRHIDATPFAHSPCSVLSGEPCTPATCSVLNHGPCSPEIDYPIGENLQVTVLSVPGSNDMAKYRRPDHDLDTIGDLFAALRSCWSPPADAVRVDMQMSVMFSFKKSGEMIAPPRMTFATPGASADERQTYLHAIDASLQACTPLPLTAGLGGAIAGRPIMIRYVDNREAQKPG